LDAGSYVLNVRSGKNERISRIMQMHANKQNPIDFIEAGDIGAAVGFKDIKTGDTLCDEKNPIILENMFIPEPVISIAIEPKTQADVDKMGMAIAKLIEEDPTLRVKTDEETGQTVLSGMGELHLEIILDRMRREFKVEVNQGAPQVAYKEAFTAMVSHRETYKKQTGGRGKFADILVKISHQDNPEKKGLEFINSIKGGNIPREFIPSVEKGFRESMKNGVLAGFPLESMKVGVPVIGLVPDLVPSWMDENNGVWINNKTMLVDVLSDFIQNWLEDNINPSLFENMETTVGSLQTIDNFERKVVELFEEMLYVRLESFEAQLNKLQVIEE
jgi:elongation factor G